MRLVLNFTLVLTMSFVDITHLTVLKITGDDAESFLQGQLTNDLSLLNNEWHYSAYCTPKGRVLAIFTVWKAVDNVYLLVEKSVCETVVARLRMYVMRSKVNIETLNVKIVGAFDQTESEHGTKESSQKLHSVDIDDNRHSLHWVGRSIHIDLAATEAQRHDTHLANDWIARDIKDALPRVVEETSEKFVPQMLNMDLLNGISFKKGCYTGQEIVARMKYLGKLKQRMLLCQMEPNAAPVSIGQKLFDANKKPLGDVVNAMPNLGLFTACLRHENIGDGLYSENEERLASLVDMPYELT